MPTDGLIALLAELESSGLEVVLVPCRRKANDGGCIRVAANKNCEWYRRFCARHPSSRVRTNRHSDTRIKRRSVVRILSHLIEGKPSMSKYATELLAEAKRLEDKLRIYAY